MKLLLAGGGTAGHIEPALAVARKWQEKHPNDEIIFLGTAAGLEQSLIPAAGFQLTNIPKVAIARSLSPSLLKVPFLLISAIRATMKDLNGVDCAIGFGGYVSGPLYIAAALKRVPFVIHEQNARPGWANRMGARLTSYTAVSYPVSRGALSRAALTGLPLRQDVLAAIEHSQGDWRAARRNAKAKIAAQYGLSVEEPLIFIFGGSQGSHAINRTIEDAKPFLESAKVSVLLGVGKNNPLPASSKSYKALAYIDQMADAYLAADLLIARSGAVTCAEATALSRFNLFIPLPIGNGEQALNAQGLVDAGRARVIEQGEFTAEWLRANLTALLSESARRSESGDTSGVSAVDKIVEIIEAASGAQ
jgi:UDP-N-acetylglucosamine--N-acetylmuramyl-(pentapeptide) pyrophosphoryl-undecaprenol N-acetylglucosamine transferase